MFQKPRELRDRVIVITGGGTGIGAATARACDAAGMRVVVAGRRREKLDAVVGPLQQGLAVTCDVDRDDDVQRLIDASRERFGRIDVLFANAGYGLVAPVLETPDAQARAIFETNLFGTMRLLRLGVPVVLQTSDQPHLLICSSSASEISPPHYGFYAATKAAQDSLACAMRAELRERGVAVTSIHPTGTRTEFFDASHKIHGNDPVLNTPRWAFQTPEHVARCILAALRRPRPEVWPSPVMRFALGALTMFPSLQAWVVARMMKNRRR